MLDLGLPAGLAFTVGIGILPVIGGLTSLHLRERRGEPAYRAFAAFLGGAIVCVVALHGGQGRVPLDRFATLTEERNMIYLSPLMLIGTALVLPGEEVDWRLVAARRGVRRSSSCSRSRCSSATRTSRRRASRSSRSRTGTGAGTSATCSWALARLSRSVLVLVLLAPPARGRRRHGRPCSARVDADLRDLRDARLRPTSRTGSARSLPAQLDWVDRRHARAAGHLPRPGDRTTRTACCSPSSGTARSSTSSAWTAAPRARARRGTPDIVSTDGTLSRIPPDTRYILADNGVTCRAPSSRAAGGKRALPQARDRWRLRDAVQQVYSDGWAPDGRPTRTSGRASAAHSTSRCHGRPTSAATPSPATRGSR